MWTDIVPITGTTTYTVIAVDKHISRGALIEAIIRTQYSDYGAELAAINNGGDDYTDYQSFRDAAKTLADNYLQYKQ